MRVQHDYRTRLWDRLEGRLRNRLGGRLEERLWGRLRGRLWGRLWGRLRDRLWDRLRDRLRDQGSEPAIAQQILDSYVDEEGDRHEIVEEPRDRIATLQEQVRILREAAEVLIDWMGEAEIELGGPLNVGYKARMQKPVAVEKVRAALEATKEKT